MIMDKISKITFIGALLLILGLFNACEKAETSTEVIEETLDKTLIGKWFFQKVNPDNSEDDAFKYSAPIHSLKFDESGLVTFRYSDEWDTVDQIPDENDPEVIHVMLGERKYIDDNWEGTWITKDHVLYLTVTSINSKPETKEYVVKYSIRRTPDNKLELTFDDKLGPYWGYKASEGPYTLVE